MQIIDLHNHTKEGSYDASISIHELLKVSKEQGIDAVGITEHDSFQSKKYLSKLMDEPENEIFFGIEVSTKYGHLLAYGIPDSLWDVDIPAIDTKWLLELAKDKKWISVDEMREWLGERVTSRMVWDATELIQTTHQYGGVFTLALKLTVGMAPKKLMRELHRSPDMRKMITELNQPFQPQFLLMDGLEGERRVP